MSQHHGMCIHFFFSFHPEKNMSSDTPQCIKQIQKQLPRTTGKTYSVFFHTYSHRDMKNLPCTLLHLPISIQDAIDQYNLMVSFRIHSLFQTFLKSKKKSGKDISIEARLRIEEHREKGTTLFLIVLLSHPDTKEYSSYKSLFSQFFSTRKTSIFPPEERLVLTAMTPMHTGKIHLPPEFKNMLVETARLFLYSQYLHNNIYQWCCHLDMEITLVPSATTYTLTFTFPSENNTLRRQLEQLNPQEFIDAVLQFVITHPLQRRRQTLDHFMKNRNTTLKGLFQTDDTRVFSHDPPSIDPSMFMTGGAAAGGGGGSSHKKKKKKKKSPTQKHGKTDQTPSSPVTIQPQNRGGSRQEPTQPQTPSSLPRNRGSSRQESTQPQTPSSPPTTQARNRGGSGGSLIVPQHGVGGWSHPPRTRGQSTNRQFMYDRFLTGRQYDYFTKRGVTQKMLLDTTHPPIRPRLLSSLTQQQKKQGGRSS